jgi:hypothetical protein
MAARTGNLVGAVLRDGIEYFVHVLLFVLPSLLISLWSQIGMPWEVRAMGFVTSAPGLFVVALVSLRACLRQIRLFRTEWRETFTVESKSH